MAIDKELAQVQANQAIDALRNTGLVPEQDLQILNRMATVTIEVAADLEEKGGFKTLGASGVSGETVRSSYS